MGFILPIIPVITVLLLFLTRKSFLQHIINLLASGLLVIGALLLTYKVVNEGSIRYGFLGGIFYVDALSVIVLDIVIIIGLVTSIYSVGYLQEEIRQEKIRPGQIKRYYLLMYSFIFTMVMALTVNNLGLMWIAIEATTLASAFLVGFDNNKYALEAAWKYVIICSVGIAIAFLGIILFYLSARGVLSESAALDWVALYENAKSLQSPVLRLAFIFILVGFGTKAGLAPMHTWLPDAHSQAPSPISALLSGVLLNSAMYGIIRALTIVNCNLENNIFTGRVLLAIGILSILTAAIFIMTQRDYKRLLAYSSIEHMGIIAVAMGVFTPLAVFGGLLHMINHSLTKSMLFLSAGNILQKFNTMQISKIKGVLKILPFSGTAFLLGLFAIAGTPPFSIFSSEINIIVALFSGGSIWIGVVLVLLLAVVFAGIVASLFRMFYGEREQETLQPGEINKVGTGAIVVLLIAITLGGLFMPSYVIELIYQAQGLILGI
ncbi:MAG: hydrogenase 4 subunit F [Peptococcaceae bacterium]|nr:hydrogenase 4 subunit F [Peptococcaceae bacterium]